MKGLRFDPDLPTIAAGLVLRVHEKSGEASSWNHYAKLLAGREKQCRLRSWEVIPMSS
jgi:hypothetical protein